MLAAYLLKRGTPWGRGLTFGPGNDDWWYHEQALAILHGDPMHPVAYFGAVPSFFFAGIYSLFGEHLLVTNIVMVAVSASLVPAAYILASRILAGLARSRHWSLLAATSVAISPMIIRPSPLALGDSLALASAAWSFVLVTRGPRFAGCLAAGLLAGFSISVRTIFGAPVVVGLVMLSWNGRRSGWTTWRQTFALVFGAIAPVATRTAWNYQQLGHLLLDSNGGVNFYLSNLGGPPPPCAALPEWQFDSCYYEHAWATIADNPGPWILTLFGKLNWLFEYNLLDSVTVALAPVGFVALVAARRGRRASVALLPAVAYAGVLWIWAVQIERYKMPLVFVAAILAPAGFVAVVQGIGRFAASDWSWSARHRC